MARGKRGTQFSLGLIVAIAVGETEAAGVMRTPARR